MSAPAALYGNPGVPFDETWLDDVPAVRGFKPKETEPTVHDIRQITSLLDLTLLNSDDTPERVQALIQAAVWPLGENEKVSVAGLCVYPVFLEQAGSWLAERGVRLVTVAGAFPHALSLLDTRLEEVRLCARLAQEVDVPLPRYLMAEGRWDEVYREAGEIVQVAGGVPVKLILGTGELPDAITVYRAAMVAMMAGASFVKTSTGKERINATLDAGTVLCRAIKDYAGRTGYTVGLKPAGGIRTTREAMGWIDLVRDRLGEKWLTPDLFRIGASSLLDDLRFAMG